MNEQVKRNITRFPSDFMFQLSDEEAVPLRSQFATLKHGRGYHRKYLPYAFTEQGVAMLSTHKELAHKLADLERKIERHDEEIKVVFDAIRQLMAQPEPKEKKIGFRVRER